MIGGTRQSVNKLLSDLVDRELVIIEKDALIIPDVEALCDRILLVNRGRSVLYGPLAEIKRDYAPNLIRVRASHIPPNLPGVVEVAPDDDAHNLDLADGGLPRPQPTELVSH